MRWFLVAMATVHGLVHFLGVAKAFGFAEIPQLAEPISRSLGWLWLFAGLAFLVTAVLVVRSPTHWWAVGFVAVAVSQAVILTSWSDARFGTVANLVVLAAALYGFAAEGPLSLRADYRREVASRVSGTEPGPLTEAALTGLPEPIRRYVAASGAVGQPAVRDFVASGRGRIREGPDDPWMSFTFRQHNYVREPSRFFLMDARRGGLPVDVFHAFRDGEATMRVRLLSAAQIVDATGPALTRAEIVTLLNDLCVFAPGALVDPAIEWEPVDHRSARARYTLGENTVSALLSFNDRGELVDFVSDDRLFSPTGEDMRAQRWSTPLSDYRAFGPLRLASRGEGVWHPPEGRYAYIELEILDVRMNPEDSTP